LFRFIKAIIPLLTMMVNLPCLKGSCPNFLRPTCSYTECSLSLLTGSCPTERTTASYSSCLYLDFTDLLFPQGTVIRGRFPLSQLVGHYADVVPFVLHRYQVPFQNPAQFQNPLEPGRVLDESVFGASMLCCNHFLFFRMFDVYHHLLRIVNRPSL